MIHSLLQLFLPIYTDTHWHVHIVNLHAKRVELLSSLPLTRGKYIKGSSKRLSHSLGQYLKAYDVLTEIDIGKMEHVYPYVMKQENW